MEKETKVAAVSMKNITKTFGSVIANDKVNLDIYKGEILSLLGENGSGKTTLMNMLSGIYFPDEGEIRVNGKTVTIRSPKDSFELGIGMIHQHFKLINILTAAENIILGLPGKEKLNMKQVEKEIRKLTEQYGFDLNPSQKIYDMSVSQKQTVEIVKVLYRGADILILDEPTAGVDIELRRSMWGFLKDLNDKGTTIILTTHYLEEAEMLCRNIGIIQHGELVENTSMKNLLSKLKSETFILDLAPKSPLPKLEGYQYRLVDTSTLEVEVLREQGINSVFSQLSAQGIQVLSMRNKANRLEELFVSLVHDKQGDKA